MSLPPEVLACARAVEAGDPDRFAAAMAAPAAARPRLWPLYALNLELARAPYASAEPMVAEMRLQWWVDQIGALGRGGRAGGEVAMALGSVMDRLPADLLMRMAEARRWECWHEPFEGREAFDAFLDQTGADLMWAAALSLGAAPAAEPVVRDFGWAAALAAWLAAVPELEARGRFPLVDGRPAAVAALAREGLGRIARARARRHLVSRQAIPALWAGWAARGILKRAAAEPARVAGGGLGPGPGARGRALMLRALTGYW